MAEQGGKEPSLDPRGRIPGYGLFLFAAIVIGGATGGVVYLETLGNLFPTDGVLRVRFSSRDAADLFGGWRPPTRSPGGVAYVVETPSNIECAAKRHFDLAGQVAHWSILARRLGFEVRGVAAPPVARSNHEVWIVPWSICLDAEHLSALDAFLRGGGGVVIGGPVDVSRAARETSPLLRWLGARMVKNLGDQGSPFLIAAHRTAATAALDPGQRIELNRQGEAWAVDVPHPALYWSRWELSPLVAPNGGHWAAAAVARVGAGRLVWFGVPATRTGRTTGRALNTARALALAWGAREPVAALAPWPDSHPHAFVTAVDVASEPRQASAAARHLAERGIPATFFWFADSLAGTPVPSAIHLGKEGFAEVASRGDRPVEFAGQPRTRQARRMRTSRRRLEAAVGAPVRGLHPPGEAIDELTVRASAGSGYSYMLGDPAYDRAYPRHLSLARQGLAILSRAGSGDDFAHIVAAGRHEPERLGSRFLHDLRRVQDLGGLYVLNLRTDLVADRAFWPALDRILSEARRTNAWMATASRVAAWTGARRAIAVRPDPRAGRVVVQNSGAGTVEGLVLELYEDEPTPRRVPLPPLLPGEDWTTPIPSRL